MAESELPSGTVTFLFTDIEGSTRLLQALGVERYGQALAEHRRLLRETFCRHGGVEVDTQGDAFFYAFSTALGALEAAAEGQGALAQGPVRVRMGLHTGTPHLSGEGYVGEDVHRGARIAAAGHGGQVLVSSSTRALLDTSALRDLGEHRLKDLSAPEHLYQLGEMEFPSLETLHRTNLPVPATPFLGREHELHEVVGLLKGGDVRLLTLTGPGGTGKTRLALQAAAEAVEEFPDGLTWVALAPLRDPELLLSAVAQAVGVEEEPGRQLADTLVARLSSGRRLLLLDNAEHLLPQAADDVARLQAAHGVTVLVTSRERLQLQAERVWEVPPLDEQDGVALFSARARALEASYMPSPTAKELCERLDNLPLALELAAARTPLFTLEELLDRLGERLDLLKGGRDADPRQRTLRATIEWSYDLLAPEEQRLFRALAVFAGGCTYEAAETACGADPDGLQSLLDKSLLRRRDSGAASRYWMLETIREYAAERLESAGETDIVGDRHAGFFVELVEKALHTLHGPAEARTRERVVSEAANVVAAIEWARRRDDPERLLRLTLGGEILLLPPRQQVIWFEEAFERSEALSPALLARGYRGAGGVRSAIHDDLEEAKSLLLSGASLYQELDDPEGEALTLRILGGVLSETGEAEEGRVCLRRALALSERSGGAYDYAILHHLGELEREHGDPKEAADLLLRSIELARGKEDLGAVANALHGLGDLLLSQRNPNGAEDRYKESLALNFELKSRRGCTYCLRGLAATAALQGQTQRAGQLWGAASAIEQQSGYGISARTYAQYERTVANGKGHEFDAAVTAAGHMTLDEAVAYALQSPSSKH